MEVGIGKYMKILGSTWKYWEVYENTRKYMEVHGSTLGRKSGVQQID